MLRMAMFVLFIVAAAAPGCGVMSDGPFEQVGGRPIDYDAYEQLIEDQTTIEQTLSLLGQPFSQVALADGEVRFEYLSIKTRRSVERTLGITTGIHSQTMEEKLTIVFQNGTLVSKQKSSNVALK